MRADFLSLLCTSTLVMSVAIVVVWLLRATMRRHFGAQACYAMWLIVPIVAVAVLIPVRAHDVMPQWTSVATATVTEAVSARLPPIESTSWNPLPAMFAAWLIGALTMALLMLLQQRRYLRSLGPLTALGDGIHRAQSPNAGPALVGLLAPKIVVPGDFEARFDADERALIIAHERRHRARGDAWANAIVAAMRSVFWFNPLVHAAARMFRIDQEIACDADVVAVHPDRRRMYATALLKAQFTNVPLPLGCQWTSSLPLRERIVALRAPLHPTMRKRTGTALVIVLMSLLSVTAWAIQPAQSSETPSDDESVVEVSIRFLPAGVTRASPVKVGSKGVVFGPAIKDPANGPSWTRMLTAVGEPVVLTSVDSDVERQVEVAFWLMHDGNIEAKLRFSHDGVLLSEPFMIMRSGEPATIAVGNHFASDPEMKVEIMAREGEWPE